MQIYHTQVLLYIIKINSKLIATNFVLFVAVCPEGYYGDHCMTPCECKNDNFVCHPAEGCICRHGYTGENCNSTLYASTVQEREEGGYGSMVAGIFVALILVAIIVALLFYYRRRVANLKTEIAHVQYIADPHAFSPGK